MANASIFLIFIMLLGGGQGNDLLSLIASEHYWKAKDVELTTPAMMLELNSIKPDDTSKEVAVRRLMAIRTLGELKGADAIASLQSQLESKDMFVADYAQRAIDQIEGKPVKMTAAVPADRMKADLYMLPEGVGGVGQVRLLPSSPVDLKKKLENPDADPAVQSPLSMVAMALIGFAEQTGNIQIDGVTIGVSDVIGPNEGFVALLIRGKWDVDAINGVLGPHMPNKRMVGEVEFVSPQFGGMALAIASSELAVFASGPGPGNIPVDELGEAIKSGKGKFENCAELVKVIESVDTSDPIWAAMIVSECYKQAPMLAPFENLTLTAKLDGDDMKYHAKALGRDAASVQGAIDEFNKLIEEARREFHREMERDPSGKPLADFFDSMDLKSDGLNATGTATMKRGPHIIEAKPPG